jgi:hypothetical protein
LASIIFFLLVTLSTVHLSGWNFMHHSFSQYPSLSRSFCRVSASLLLDIVRYAIVSSAKSPRAYARVSYIRQIFRPHVHKQITMGPAHKLYYQQSK